MSDALDAPDPGASLINGETLATDAERPAPAVWLREPIHLHFLCNTLHALQGLVHRDPDRVERMLDELCELLGHLLHSTRVRDVAVRAELAALRAYANLQRLRFQDRLQVHLHVDDDLLERRVPGFLVYPLLENAVKFGLETGPTPTVVTVAARARDGRLVIEVANTGAWVTPGAAPRRVRGYGVALASVRERLHDLFPGGHRFTIVEQDGWVRARLDLPLA